MNENFNEHFQSEKIMGLVLPPQTLTGCFAPIACNMSFYYTGRDSKKEILANNIYFGAGHEVNYTTCMTPDYDWYLYMHVTMNQTKKKVVVTTPLYHDGDHILAAIEDESKVICISGSNPNGGIIRPHPSLRDNILEQKAQGHSPAILTTHAHYLPPGLNPKLQHFRDVMGDYMGGLKTDKSFLLDELQPHCKGKAFDEFYAMDTPLQVVALHTPTEEEPDRYIMYTLDVDGPKERFEMSNRNGMIWLMNLVDRTFYLPELEGTPQSAATQDSTMFYKNWILKPA